MNLPSFRLTRGAHAGSPAARPMPIVWPILYLLLFVVSLLVSFHLFFPGNLLQTRLISELNGKLPFPVQLRDTRLSFPFRVEVGELRPVPPEQWSLPAFSKMVLSPVWSSLLGDPGVELQGGTPGGGVDAVAHRSGELHLTGRGLGFVAPIGQYNLSLAGGVTESELIFLPKAEADGDLELTASLARVDLQGLEAFGIGTDLLRLGAGRIEIDGDRKKLEVKTLALTGGDLGVEAKGTIQVGSGAADTRLNLNVTLTPAASLDSSLQQMLALLGKPGADGSIRFRLSGTLAAPRTK